MNKNTSWEIEGEPDPDAGYRVGVTDLKPVRTPPVMDKGHDSLERRDTHWVGRYQLTIQDMIRIHLSEILTVSFCILAGLSLSYLFYRSVPREYKVIGTFLVNDLPFVQTQRSSDPEMERTLLQSLILSIANADMRSAVAKQLGVPINRIAFIGIDPPVKNGEGTLPGANVEVSAVKNSRLGSISADSTSPTFAVNVVNAILDQLRLYNLVGGQIKAAESTAAFSKSQADGLLAQISEVTAQRIKLERENAELDNYLKHGLPLASYPTFAQDATLGNLKTQLFLVESEYKALAATVTRGQRIDAKASELKSLRLQLAEYSEKLASSLRYDYNIRKAQEQDLLANKLSLAERYNQSQQDATRLSQTFGNPAEMEKRTSEIRSKGEVGDANMIVVVDRARPPLKPSHPVMLLHLMVGGFLGSVMGLLLAGSRLFFDSGIVLPAQIETRLSIPCLAILPRRKTPFLSASAVQRNGAGSLYWLRLSELCNRLLSGTQSQQCRIIGFASVDSGKRSMGYVADLAGMMADGGKRTLLIDLHPDGSETANALRIDLRKNSLQMLLSGIPLSEILSYSSNRNLALFTMERSCKNLSGEIHRRPITIDWENLLTAWDCIFIDAPCFVANQSLHQFLPPHAPLVLTAKYERTRMSAMIRSISTARANRYRIAGAVITAAPGKHAT